MDADEIARRGRDLIPVDPERGDLVETAYNIAALIGVSERTLWRIVKARIDCPTWIDMQTRHLCCYDREFVEWYTLPRARDKVGDDDPFDGVRLEERLSKAAIERKFKELRKEGREQPVSALVEELAEWVEGEVLAEVRRGK